MKIPTINLLQLVGLTLVLGSLNGCSYWSMTPEEKAHWFTEEVSDELELNKNQRSKLEILVDTFMKSREVFYKDRQSEREAVLEMVQADNLDQRRALEMIRKKTRIIEQQAPAVVSAYGDLHNSLNKEQRARIQERLVEMFDYYDKRRKGQ